MWSNRKRASDFLLPGILCAVTFLFTACSAKPAVKTPQHSTKPTMMTVAVLTFEDLTIDHPAETVGLGETVANLISDRIIEQPEFTLVDRESIDKVLEELSLSSQGLTGPEGRLKLGRLLGARYLVAGDYMSIGGTLRIDARVIDVEAGHVKGRAVEGPLSERRRIASAISKEVWEELLAKTGY